MVEKSKGLAKIPVQKSSKKDSFRGNFLVLQNKYERVFAIGDIHGCSNELIFLLNYLEIYEKLDPQKDLVIFLGDYIDRGPNSKKVIDFLIGFREEYPNTRFLKGNHEDSMLMFFGCEGSFEADRASICGGYLHPTNGGVDFCKSYGIDLGGIDPQKHSLKLSLLPDVHRSFFLELDYGLILDDMVFVHAGILPNVPLEEQKKEDLLWIRDRFIGRKHGLDKTIIFGHTPFKDVFKVEGQIGIDTGLVFGNKLTCLEVFSEKLFQVGKGDTLIKTSSLKSLP